MIKKLIPVFLFLLNFLFLESAFGQIQMNIPDYISQKFQSYCKSVPREEIFVHTDREEYISGEDLWFNIYLIDRQSFKPSSNSKIVYFEILNPENSPVLQKKILLDNGFGPGQVVLPDTLSSGTYTIRAYTNWMKNFLSYNCFLKDIKVYNPLRTKVFRRSARSMNLKGTATDVLPANSGLNLKVNNLKQDSLEIFIHTDEKFRSENKNLIYLFIQTHGIINHLSAEKIAQEITRIAIPKKSLPPGINQITIFDSNGPVCDRFIYTPSKEKQALTLHSIESCKQRNKVTLEIEIGNESSDISDLTNLSISVASGTNSPEIMDLNDYLVLGTEFGLFHWSTIKGEKITELPPEIMDSLLLTVKSNWINWESILSNEVQLFKYPLKKETQYLSGRLLTSNLQPVQADEILLMSTPGREAVFQYTRTDKDGNFNFKVHIDEEPKDLILQPDIKSKNQKVYVESSFSDQYLQTEIFVDSTSELIPSFISRQNINYQVRKIYGSSSIGDRLTPVIPPLTAKRFYGTPDFELIMKDFIKLDSMQEVFFELVPHVALEYINSVYEMSIVDPFGNKLDGVPGIMIDGVIIKDLSIIANLDPELVEKIDVVWDKYRVGGYLFNGIVNIISKTGDFNSGTLPVDAVRLHYSVIDTVCSFVSPDYSSTEMKNSRLADFRNTLYWNSSIKLDKNGKARIEFWSADIKSDYIINIQGITSEGKTVSLRKIIKVK
ncbi:MAG: hypothetical protein NTX93_02475 [Bacteroidia bacterium]|nr:hypothetical protein [Bacteroidia bacterium]